MNDLEKTVPKPRPLVLDPVVIATFGDFHASLRAHLTNCLLYKDSGCTSQSTQQDGLGGSGTEKTSQ